MIPLNPLRSLKTALALLTSALILTACQGNNPPQPPVPTAIPSATPTQVSSPTATVPGTPLPSLAPLVTATGIALAPTDAPVVGTPTQQPTPTPRCTTAKQNDTVFGLIHAAGYNDLKVWAEFCAMNNMPNSCSNLQAGKQYCVPAQTWTPTPPGRPETQTAIAIALPSLQHVSSVPGSYTIVEGDNIIAVQIKTGASLRELCDLNSPDPINCAGCQIDKPIGQQGCAPRLKLGAVIKIPGPTLTPTITPTLTGSETATPTPLYRAPLIVAPGQGTTVSGIVQLIWLPSGILQPGELYLVLVTDVTSGQTRELETGATSLRLPLDMQPPTGQTHTINWRVSVAHRAEDGTYVQIGHESLIYTFSWQGQ